MKLRLNKSFLMLLVFVSGILLLSSHASADLPWLDYSGSFTYDYSHQDCTEWKGPPSNGNCKTWGPVVYDYTLSLSGWNISGGNYASGPGTNFGEGDDPITNAYIEINGTSNTLYNSASPSNLNFGSGTFTITDGTTDWLTADLANFMVDDETFFGNATTQLNKTQDDNNITNVLLTSDTSSAYINELRNSQAPFNLSWEFSFNSGGPYGDDTAFTEDSSGTFQGKLYSGPVVPEPVSSVLFITGGAALALRCYRKSKN